MLSRWASAGEFVRGAVSTTAVLAILVALCLAIPEHADGGLLGRIAARFATVRKARSSADLNAAETAGYYEGLFAQSARMASANDLLAGRWDAGWTRRDAMAVRRQHRRRDDFLHYELLPNLDTTVFGARLVTNSAGMADREYPVARQEPVRRIALLGDSVARGLGANPGANFESLLEDDLNGRAASLGGSRFEILNLAVEGYRTTQIVEVAVTKAAAYRPDVYALCVTDLSVFRKWGDHLAQLVHDGVDVKYDYLRDLVNRSGLRPGDGRESTDSKLAPFRLDVLRWAVETIRSHARAEGAEIVVLLVPAARDAEIERRAFEGVHDVLAASGVPVIDLLDTFDGIRDLAPYRVSASDMHPTDAGHARIFERLLSRLEHDPAARSALIGTH